MAIRRFAAGFTAVLVTIGTLATPTAAAAATSTVTVHFSDPGKTASGGISVTTLAGDAVEQVSSGYDDFGEVTTWAFDGLEDQTPVGITATKDSVFPDDLRYVRADGADDLEVWLVDRARQHRVLPGLRAR